MKRLSVIILALCLLLCGCNAEPEPVYDESKLQIVCTSFPAYDFVREIVGDNVELTLLIKPGSEVHSYEPTPKDMIRIRQCDLFICNGGAVGRSTHNAGAQHYSYDGLRRCR